MDRLFPSGDDLTGGTSGTSHHYNCCIACGPVLYELVQGARSEKEQAELTNALSALPFLEMTEALWVKAGRLSASLRKTGKTLPFSDILIATVALENNLTVMTVDEHFRSIPGLAIDAME